MRRSSRVSGIAGGVTRSLGLSRYSLEVDKQIGGRPAVARVDLHQAALGVDDRRAHVVRDLTATEIPRNRIILCTLTTFTAIDYGGARMAVWVGTSGYNYPEWKGSFYPQDLPAAKMLPYYAARFPTVEINYTFYRMPNEKLVSGWAAQTPSPYKLTLKAPRRITHDNRLKNCGSLVSGFCQVAGTLGDRLGALLFQLPPNLKKDLTTFDAFLAELPPKVCGAFEFRHASWLDDEIFARLAQRNLALCVADSEK